MRIAFPALLALLLAAGCGPGLPFPSPLPGSAAEAERRGAVEVFVKANHPALSADIVAGGGPSLTRAFDIARVPAADRAARTLQLGADAGLYAANPGALVTALVVYGSAAG